ncbi:hypothetical protein [Natrarchaeobaculum aegyptiacum]|uniref:ParB/Sulfiredoxin domain-containing protein n=1 Tax=Natrarchaeobaculum aegyptiacum TaxID=745377 RepID=A0A2Z2HT73_9EURY|nr:hypothetical protein [Natrarchaeobaculum aegyptiacum]ARS89973.1 hypothetical protein B1756_09685 [Natrarchaeobaculum aegyptiacum]
MVPDVFRSRLHLLYSLYKRNRASLQTWMTTARRYDAPIDPFELQWVDPATIELLQEGRSRFRNRSSAVCLVEDGDWDRQVSRFEDHDMYVSFEQHFLEGADWQETPWVQRVTSEIEDQGLTLYGCESAEEFYERCSGLDAVFENIRENGYTTQRELIHGSTDNEMGHTWAYYCPELHEISVNVARDGEFIFWDGWHRCTMSKVLGLEEVPVRVFVRHSEWQAKRDRVANGAEVVEDPGHPDLAGL